MLTKTTIQIIIVLLFITYLTSTKTEKETICVLSLILVGIFFFINNNKEPFSNSVSYSALKNNNIFNQAKQNWDNYKNKKQTNYTINDRRLPQNSLIQKKIDEQTCNKGTCQAPATQCSQTKEENQCSNRDQIEKKIDELKYMLNNTCF
jgi:hypothetical protein